MGNTLTLYRYVKISGSVLLVNIQLTHIGNDISSFDMSTQE